MQVEYGTKLIEISKDKQYATFEDIKTGAKEIRPYDHLYQMAPTKPHDVLVNSGLANHRGLLDVDIQTLQHKKYKNIFGLGDVNDVPTTKAFWAGFH